MLPNWLTGSAGSSEQGNDGDRHVVLGSPLRAPLMEDQEEIVFGCGCFWGAEKGFWRLPGVISTSVGYAGGETDHPSYDQVCSGRTGHTEVVRVVWSTPALDVSDLLKLFWECHDPTQGNRQGNDRGSQYRSAVYTTTARQMQMVEASRAWYQNALSAAGHGEITTEIAADRTYYFAESYHQQYLARPGSRPYCSAMPTGIRLGNFDGADYRLPEKVWSHYDWSISHCVLRGDNSPITLNP